MRSQSPIVDAKVLTKEEIDQKVQDMEGQ